MNRVERPQEKNTKMHIPELRLLLLTHTNIYSWRYSCGMDYADLNISRLFLSTIAGRREAKKAGRDLAIPHYTQNKPLHKGLSWHTSRHKNATLTQCYCVSVRYFTWVLAATSEDTGLLQVLIFHLSAPSDCYWYTRGISKIIRCLMWNNESRHKNIRCEVGQQQSYYQDEQ